MKKIGWKYRILTIIITFIVSFTAGVLSSAVVLKLFSPPTSEIDVNLGVITVNKSFEYLSPREVLEFNLKFNNSLPIETLNGRIFMMKNVTTTQGGWALTFEPPIGEPSLKSLDFLEDIPCEIQYPKIAFPEDITSIIIFNCHNLEAKRRIRVRWYGIGIDNEVDIIFEYWINDLINSKHWLCNKINCTQNKPYEIIVA